MDPKTPEISKSPFHAENYLNLEPLNRFNENLLPSNKAVLQRLIKIQQDSPKSTSIKSIATQIYTESCEIYKRNEIEMKTKINSINKIIKLHQNWFNYSKSMKHKTAKKHPHVIKFLNELNHICDLRKARNGGAPIKKETKVVPEKMEISSNTSNDYQPSPFL